MFSSRVPHFKTLFPCSFLIFKILHNWLSLWYRLLALPTEQQHSGQTCGQTNMGLHFDPLSLSAGMVRFQVIEMSEWDLVCLLSWLALTNSILQTVLICTSLLWRDPNPSLMTDVMLPFSDRNFQRTSTFRSSNNAVGSICVCCVIGCKISSCRVKNVQT